MTNARSDALVFFGARGDLVPAGGTQRRGSKVKRAIRNGEVDPVIEEAK